MLLYGQRNKRNYHKLPGAPFLVSDASFSAKRSRVRRSRGQRKRRPALAEAGPSSESTGPFSADLDKGASASRVASVWGHVYKPSQVQASKQQPERDDEDGSGQAGAGARHGILVKGARRGIPDDGANPLPAADKDEVAVDIRHHLSVVGVDGEDGRHRDSDVEERQAVESGGDELGQLLGERGGPRNVDRGGVELSKLGPRQGLALVGDDALGNGRGHGEASADEAAADEEGR